MQLHIAAGVRDLSWVSFIKAPSSLLNHSQSPPFKCFHTGDQASTCELGHAHSDRSIYTEACACTSCLVMSDSVKPHVLQPARLLCPWDFPGKSTGVGFHFLLERIFSTQESNSHLLHWEAGSLALSNLGTSNTEVIKCKFSISLTVMEILKLA